MYQIEPRADLEIRTITAGLRLNLEERSIDLEGDSGPGRAIRIEDDGSTIVYSSERGATFELIDGKEMFVDPASIETSEEVVLNLLGPLLRLVLLQRGEHVLHASVVRLGARTAAFIAPAGHGKSTMAAGLYDRGHGVLSDDAGIIRLESGPTVLAGPPVLKLHEETAARIDRDTKPVFPDGFESDKRFYHLTDNEVPGKTALDAVYLIERGDTIELEAVSAHKATVEFIANSWNLPDRDDAVVAENLRWCAELAGEVVVKRARYPRSFGAFDDVLSRIEEDCDYER